MGMEEATPPPSVAWLSPVDGETVAAGDVACSVLVEGFTLIDPAKHNEGTPEGYLQVSVDASEEMVTASTTFTLPLEAGAHSLGVGLLYSDGDEVVSDGEKLCEEGDSACDPVVATIEVIVE
jgi:hypothetical protein